jgi:hypothetical protein
VLGHLGFVLFLVFVLVSSVILLMRKDALSDAADGIE